MTGRIDSHERGEDPGVPHGEQWNADLAAYALDALDVAERRAVEEHLAGCAACSERLRWMMPAVDVLPATVPPQSPPPELKARIMDAVESEAASVGSAAGSDRAARERSAPKAPRGFLGLGGIALRPALAGLGALLLLAAAVTGYALRDGDGDGGESEMEMFVAKSERPASPASGRLEVRGDAGMLHVTNLPPTERDEVYQAWIEDEGSAGGAVHASSVFVVSEDGVGDVAIPHGLGEARRVMITREPLGGSDRPSENSLLTAEMG